MDWASSQWKEGLPSVALQKVSALEGQIGKLQKERQQKQLQFECLELTLSKEKRKVEEEKQQTLHLERELQSLADTCKGFENKHQKLQAEIQIRDTKLTNLEGQLAQAKKQNSRLQQLENDLEDLRSLRDNSKLETKELQEKLKREQSTVVKQNDAISDLEQTIKSLQEKHPSNERSVLINIDDKENFNTLHESTTDGSSTTEPLRRKISEQENTIKALRSQLQNISDNKGKLGISINDGFQTPAKTKNVTSDAPLSSKKSFSIWDSFGSTPAKANRITKHMNESSSFDAESDEKVRTLQQKLKQVCQELECQRHNSEAAKHAMEQRLKEKENALKAEIKQYVQTITDSDRELRELKNKYQQDVIQVNKKLDVVNMQLQKSEFSKQQMEKDLKTFESQISSNNVLIRQKEEELKDLHKQKNKSEATEKKLSLEKRELERTCSGLQTEKKSLNDEIRDLKIKLDGSNNLVKEKEANIQKVKKEQDSVLKTNSDLQAKLQKANKELSELHSEKNSLEKQFQALESKFLSSKDDLENLKAEKKNMCNLLDLEKSKTGKLESDVARMKKEIFAFQSEIKSKEGSIITLKTELDDLKDNFTSKIKNLEDTLSRSKEENLQLKNQITVYSNNEITSKASIEQLKKENEKLSDSVSSKIKEFEVLEQKIENLNSQHITLQKESNIKSENIDALKEENKSVKVSYQVKIDELQKCLDSSNAESAHLKNQILEFAEKELSINNKLNQLEKDSKNMSDELSSKTKEVQKLELDIENYKTQILELQSDCSVKQNTILNLKNETEAIKDEYNCTLSSLQQNMSSLETEKNALDAHIQKLSSDEILLQEEIKQTELEKAKISDMLHIETEKRQSLETNLDEMQSNFQILQSELNHEKENFKNLERDFEEKKEFYEIKIQELHQGLSSLEAKKNALDTQIQKLSSEESLLQEQVKESELEKVKISDMLHAETEKRQSLEASLEEIQSNFQILQSELNLEKENFKIMESEFEGRKESYELKIQDLQKGFSSLEAEKNALDTQIQKLSSEESLLQEQVKESELEKVKISDMLHAETEKRQSLEASLEEIQSNFQILQSELNLEKENFKTIERDFEGRKESYELKIQNLQQSLSLLETEKITLNGHIEKLSSDESLLQEQIKQAESEKTKLSDLLNSETEKTHLLESSLSEMETNLQGLQSELEHEKENTKNMERQLAETKESSNLKIQDLQQNLSLLETEKNTLNDHIEKLSSEESLLQEQIKQVELEKMKLSDLLNSETEKTQLFESGLSEMETNLQRLLSELEFAKEDGKNMERQLAETTESYNIKLLNLQQNLATLKDEKNVLDSEIQKLSSEKFLLQEHLKEAESEKVKMLDLLNAETEKTQSLEGNLSMRETNLQDLQSELNHKQEAIKNGEKALTETKEFYELKIQDLQQSLSLLETEKNTLNAEIENLSSNEILMQEKVKEAELEKTKISDLLQVETGKTQLLESHLNETEAKLKDLQFELNNEKENVKNMKEDLATTRESYEHKTFDLQQNLTTLESERKVLDDQIQKILSEKILLEEHVKNLQVGVVKMSDQLCAETAKTQSLKSNLNEIQIKFLDLRSALNHEKESIKNMERELSETRESCEKKLSEINENINIMESEKTSVEMQLLKYVSREDDSRNSFLMLEEEKQSLSDQLTAERSKSEAVESNLMELKKNIDNLQVEIQNKNMQLKQLEDIISVTKSENENLTNQMKNYVLNEENCLHNIKHLETEKKNISELLSQETHKREMLETNIEELRRNLESFELQICTKDETISSLKSQVESITWNYEEEKSSLFAYIQDLESKVLLMQECSKKICVEYNLIENEMRHLKEDCQKLQKQDADDKKRKVEFLSNLLKQLNLIEKNADAMSEDYEEKITDLECQHELAKSEVLSLQHRIEENYNTNGILQRNYVKELELQNQAISKLTSREEELKTSVMDLLIELSSKDEYIKYLKTESEASNIISQEEKSGFITSIEDLESNLIPMQEHLQNLYVKSELLENEIRDFKCECQESENKGTEKQKIRGEFLCNLLNHLNKMEKTAEVMSKDYESQLSDATKALFDLESKASLQEEKYVMLMDEKLSLMEELKLTQAKYIRNDAELKSAMLLKEKYSTCLKENENLKNIVEHLEEEKHKFQEKITDLECQHELAKSEVLSLQHRIEETNNTNGILQKNYVKELELQNQAITELTSREEELKTSVMDLLVELSSKDEYIKYLRTESDASNIISQEEKSGFITCIEDLESNLIPMQEHLQNLYVKSELLENEIRNFKCECQKSENKGIEKQKIREEFLCNLLNHLNKIEKTAEVMSKDYESQLSDATKALFDLESKASLQEEKYVMLMDEKLSLMEELKLTQAKYIKNDTELKSAMLLKEKYSTCLKENENLKNIVEHLEEEKHKFQHIPLEVIRTVNETTMKTLPVVPRSDDENICQNIILKYASEVYDLSCDTFDRFCSLEEGILSLKEHFKFLVSHQLIKDADTGIMLVALKFLKKLCKKVYHKKSILRLFRTSENYSIFTQTQFCEEFLQTIKLLSDSDEDSNVNLFFEKNLLISSYRNVYLICKLKKALNSVTKHLNILNVNFEKLSVFFGRYQDVYSHTSHLPIFVDSEYIIFSYSISCTYLRMRHKCSYEIDICQEDTVPILCLDNLLDNLSAGKVPLVLSCAFELSTNQLFSCNSNNPINLNLICIMLETLTSFYKNEDVFISTESAKYLESFLSLILKEKTAGFKNIYLKKEFLLKEIVFCLLQDLSCLISSQFRHELSKPMEKLLGIRNQLNTVNLEFKGKDNSSDTFWDSLNAENEKKCDVPTSNAKSVHHVDDTFLENLKKKVFEVSKIFSVFKNMFSESLDITKLQLEVANLSDTFCLCPDCLNEAEFKTDNDVTHTLFTPVSLIHYIAKLFTSKSDFENQVIDLKKNELNLKGEITVLETDKSELIITVNGLEEKINLTNYEIEKLKSKCASLEDEYQDINTLLIESNEVQKSQLNSIQLHLDEICKCKEEYKELFTENQNLKNEFARKEQEVSCIEKAIEERTSESKVLSAKCDEYEMEIEHLNSKISTLLSEINNSKANKCDDNKVNILITELENKITSLEESNNLLNTALENVKEELQNLYVENRAVKEKLQERLGEIDNLQRENMSWKLNDIEGKNKISSFETQINDLKENECNLKEEIAKLQNEELRLTSIINDLKEEKKLAVNELESLLPKYSALNNEYNSINSLLLESSTTIENNEATIDKCKREYDELFNEKEKLKHDLIKKDQEISSFKKTAEEKVSESNALNIKCEGYKTEITQLNGTITKLITDIETLKEQKLHNNEDKILIDELQSRLASLEKSNKLLNTTVENVEDDLQNLYLEKQIVERKLEEKLGEIEGLQKEITSWKINATEGKKEISALEMQIFDLKDKETHLKEEVTKLENAKSCLEKSNSLLNTTLENVEEELQNLYLKKQTVEKKLEELEEVKQIAEKTHLELLSKHAKLQNDVNVLKNVQKEHQVSLLEKNFCIKQKDVTITQLKKTLSANEEEKKCLETNLAEIQTNLSNELQEKTKSLYDLEKKLNAALKEKLDFEEQIKVLQEEQHIKSRCDELEIENDSLKFQLEKLLQEKINCEDTIRMLDEKNMIIGKEANKAIHLQEEITAKEKTIFENSLLIQELKQKVNELRKEISENGQSAKQKVTELLYEKNTLQAEIEALKIQSNIEQICECKKESLISNAQDMKSVINYKLFVTKLINSLSDVISSIECNGESEKSKTDLLSMLKNWKCDSASLSSEVQEKIESFLKSQLRKRKELEMKLSGIIKSIYSFISEIGQYGESIESQFKPDHDFTAPFDKSCIDVSLYVFSEATVTDYALSTLTDELKKCIKMLDSYFTSMKNIIWKKDMEIKSLQECLDETKSKVGMSHNKQAGDFKTLENKCALLRLNSHRLEKKHNKLLETSENMQIRIKNLEEEKLELEKEADELAEELKKHKTSDELMETSILLSKSTKELRQLREENKFLKYALKQSQEVYNEKSTDVPGVCDMNIRDQAANSQSHAAYSSLKHPSSSYSHDM